MDINAVLGKLRTLSMPMKVLAAIALPVGVLLVGGAVVLFVLVFLALWMLVLACYAAALSLAAGAVAGVFGGIFAFISYPPVQAIFLIGCGIFCAGILMLWYRVCVRMTELALLLCRRAEALTDKFHVRKAGSDEA